MSKRLVAVAMLSLLVTAAGIGCSAKKKDQGAAAAGGAAGMGEEGLAPGGSLERYKQGSGAAGEEGPLRDVHFAFDSYELDDEARGTLRENGNWLKDNSQARVEIEGHCDERGTVEYNLALGAKRARSAKEYLVALGIPAERLSTISYGEELPLCQEHDENCWQENRRCHSVVLGE